MSSSSMSRPYYQHVSLGDDDTLNHTTPAVAAAAAIDVDDDHPSCLAQSSSLSSAASSAVAAAASSDLLNVKTGSALLVADCMGTGILALPGDMKILGSIWGLSFLLVNLFINYYAGSILCHSACLVENEHHEYENDTKDFIKTTEAKAETQSGKAEAGKGIIQQQDCLLLENNHHTKSIHLYQYQSTTSTMQSPPSLSQSKETKEIVNESITHDFISMTRVLFEDSSSSFNNTQFSTNEEQHQQQRHSCSTPNNKVTATYIVTTVYYINIFLVLGNYVLVMSHAVAAMLGEDHICIPIAGIIASILMFGVSQLRTMARLGKLASAISLIALAILVLQCLWPIAIVRLSSTSSSSSSSPLSSSTSQDSNNHNNVNMTVIHTISQFSILRKFAAASSIGFAVGSQKLLLNIRHEFKNRNDTPKSLGIALTCFGTVYIVVCILAGTDVPFFLFDVIPRGTWSRQVAGFLLWVHVSVSFAINSQALCSSIDRVWFHKTTLFSLHLKHATRWVLLSLLLSISSYIVANAIPFFGDLVSFIGALTSVPLTLLLPAIFHRRVSGFPIFCLQNIRNKSDVLSFSLVVFAISFLVCGVIGSLDSIRKDWAKHGPPFSCQ